MTYLNQTARRLRRRPFAAYRHEWAVWCVTAVLLFAAPGDAAPGGLHTGGMQQFPSRVLWAWERPEDFRRHPDQSFAVAYLAATIHLRVGGIQWVPRRQSLRLADDTPLIAVIRVESDRAWAPNLRPSDVAETASLVVQGAHAPRVRALQIDFDATLSQLPFYRDLIVETRRQLAPGVPLTITALASWCMQTWLDDLPIDEAVPMLFRMGPSAAEFRAIGESGRWKAKCCRGSVGLSTDEPQVAARGRRVYVFNPAGWSTE